MMSKGTTIKEAITKFEEKTGQKAGDAAVVTLISPIPSIEKMDPSLSTLTACTQLSLSTNQIEKIANLNGLKNLRILSLARNNIKSLSGLEAVGDTLTELWISYNQVDKLKGIGVLKKLEVLNMAWNKVSDQNEFLKLAELAHLEKLTFLGNPFAENDGHFYKGLAVEKLKNLAYLDGHTVIRHDDEEQQQQAK